MAGHIGNDGDSDVDFDFFDTPRAETKTVNANKTSTVRTNRENAGSLALHLSASPSPPCPVGTASVQVSRDREGYLRKHHDNHSFSESDNDTKHSFRRVSSDKTSKQAAKHESGPALDLTFVKSDDSEGEDDFYRVSKTTNDGAAKHKTSKCRRLSTDSSQNDSSGGEHHKSAWVEHTDSHAHQRQRNSLPLDGQRERQSDSEHSSCSLTDDSYTSSDTDDSDVTDVSPLMTPRDPAVGLAAKPPKSPLSSKSNTTSKSNLLNPASDSVDLELLMQAVLELEHDRKSETSSRSQRNKHKSSTVLFAPHPNASRKNFSFSDDKVRSIDLENQRLMKQILHANSKRRETLQQNRKKPVRVMQSRATQPRLTASAVNRMREQQRVEAENQNLLRRLQSAQPSRDLRRDTLLADYNRQTIGGVSMATVHPLATMTSTKRQHRMTTSRSCFDDGSSVSSRSTVSSRRRPQSAKMLSAKMHSAGGRPHSATVRTERKRDASSRPEWQAGW